MTPPDDETAHLLRRGRRHRGGREGRRAHQGARALDVPARGGRRRRRVRRSVRGRLEALPRSAARLVDRRRRHEVGRSPGSPNRRDTIGIDCVAMSVDDIAAQGAEPLFFLDYISVGKLVPEEIDELVAGVADGCRQARCALLGGEMSEHPGVMEPGEFDLVGFAVGVVERARGAAARRARRRPHHRLREPGPALQRLLARPRRAARPRRHATSTGAAWPGAHHSLADELLEPSVIYAPAMLKLASEVPVHAFAHVTGGGIPGNLVRVLPDRCDARRDARRVGRAADLRRDPAGRRRPRRRDGERVQPRARHARGRSARRRAARASTSCASAGHDAWLVGEIVDGHGHVRIDRRSRPLSIGRSN